MSNYKYAVVVGRFQPFHLGHQKMLEKAFKTGDKVIVVLGSAKCARNTKNPWTPAEREEMIRSTLNERENARLSVVCVRDYYYSDNLWVADVQQKVNEVTDGEKNVCLVGHRKDKSSNYLSFFPQWTFEDHASVNILNATDIRKNYFRSSHLMPHWVTETPNAEEKIRAMLNVPKSVADWLIEWAKTDIYMNLCLEQTDMEEYKKSWECAPFKPKFVTVDAVVIKSGHVLLIRRKSRPGKGLLALPGGFLGDEFPIDGMLRELKEETGILVPPKELRQATESMQVFAHPERSLRGHTITFAYLIDLGSGPLPKVKGSDDAERALWLPYFDVFSREEEFFEDHIHIIKSFIHK